MIEYYVPTRNPDCYITVDTDSNCQDCNVTHFIEKPPKGTLYIHNLNRDTFWCFVNNGYYRKIDIEEVALL